jgi:nucleotide-binding universal stress UspA family protein
MHAQPEEAKPMTAYRPCIVHPTDFSDASAAAFAHALKIALASKAELILLHVQDKAGHGEWLTFPSVRATLQMWGILNAEATPAPTIGERLGVRTAKIELKEKGAAQTVAHFIRQRGANLVVLATMGRDGLARWLQGSKAELISRESEAPTLFISSQARGFVDRRTGDMTLKNILMPIGHQPDPQQAFNDLVRFAGLFGGPQPNIQCVHVGNAAPAIHTSEQCAKVPVAVKSGPLLEVILKTARGMDLIAMPTAGHHGVFDALRGSTTEQIVRHAPCPVLALPTR